MRIRLVPLLLTCSLLSPSAFSFSKKELDKKYAYQANVDWTQNLSHDFSMPVVELLNKGLFQEAIWLLEDIEDEEAARKIKSFLRNILEKGEIQPDGVVSLGGGVTDTRLIYLPYGVKAVLKVKSIHPSSNYRSEIGAYLIDQLGKFALVPMTVLRHHKGKLASLQYFVQGSQDASKIPNYKKSAKLNVFDYLIRNQDRTVGNVLLLNGREVAIDHGLALRPDSLLGGFLRFTDVTRLSLGLKGDPIRMKFVFPKKNAEEFVAEEHILRELKTWTHAKLTETLETTLDADTILNVWMKNRKLLYALKKLSS